MPPHFRCLFFATLVSFLVASGCGGRGASSEIITPPPAKSSLKISIVWPIQTRQIPIMSKSLRLTLNRKVNEQVENVWEQLVIRPDPATTLTTEIQLQADQGNNYQLVAVAYPYSDGTGEGLASFTSAFDLILKSGETLQWSLELDSNVETIEISPGTFALEVGQSQKVTLIPKSANGSHVLVPPSKVKWSTSDPSVVKIVKSVDGADFEFEVEALKVGLATISVRDLESGVSSPNIDVRVNPVIVPPVEGTVERFTYANDKVDLFDVSGNGQRMVGRAHFQGYQLYWYGTNFSPVDNDFVGTYSSISQDGNAIAGSGQRIWADPPTAGFVKTDTSWRTAYFQDMMRSELSAVSADGSVAVGMVYYSSGNGKAIISTKDGGAKLIPVPVNWSMIARGISTDGRVVVGRGDSPENTKHACYWTEATGLVDLGDFGAQISEAKATSSNGSVIVGLLQEESGTSIAFRWTALTGVQRLGTLGGRGSMANDISADGKVIVGVAMDSNSVDRPFRWTVETGMQEMIGFNGVPGNAAATNNDGNVIVGNFYGNGGGFRWTKK